VKRVVEMLMDEGKRFPQVLLTVYVILVNVFWVFDYVR